MIQFVSLENISLYHHESWGNAPCREGTGWLEKYTIETGFGREEDIDFFSIKIEGNTICPLGDAAWPVAAAIRHFREEFEYHVRFPENKK
jgi:NADH-quinone oxidoreductase subunit F